MEVQEMEKKLLRHRIKFTKEQKEEIKNEDNEDIADFLKRTREWRNAPSSNGHKRLR